MAYPLTLRYASTIGSIGFIMASGPLNQPENRLSHMSSPLEGKWAVLLVLISLE